MRSRLSRQKNFMRLILTSGPLMALFFGGLSLLVFPLANFGPGHDAFFRVLGKEYWGVLCLASSLCGYIGLFRNRKAWWQRAHAFAVFLFCLVALLFFANVFTTGAGSPFLASFSLGLMLNSLARSTELYKSPFNNPPKNE